MKKAIVTRHQATVDFVRAERPDFADAEVRASVTADDVRGAHVIGNLPMALAALCARYEAIEFAGAAPRGAEYGLDEMRACGAQIVEYRVTRVERAKGGVAMKEVAACASSNSPHAHRISVRAPEGTQFPARGHWVDLGETGRVRVVEFAPDPDAPHLAVIVHGRVPEARGFAPVVEFHGAHEGITLGVAVPGAILRERTGYKYRSEGVIEVTEDGIRPADPARLAEGRKVLTVSVGDLAAHRIRPTE